MTITEFLEARITEDEAEANERVVEEWFDGGWPAKHCNKILAECAAKRAIIAAFDPKAPDLDPYVGVSVIAMLAAVYSDHPDYDEKWKP